MSRSHQRVTATFIVNEAALDAPLLPQLIAKVFKLTPTELRVLLATAEFGPAPEVAVVLGIAKSTVRTHLNQLFKNTGVSCQVDLVKLVAGFCR